MILLKLPVCVVTSEPKISFIFARSSLSREGIWQLASSPILHSQLWRRHLIGHKAALWQQTSVSNADSRGQSWQCCIKVKVNIFRANLFLSFLSCEDQTVFSRYVIECFFLFLTLMVNQTFSGARADDLCWVRPRRICWARRTSRPHQVKSGKSQLRQYSQPHKYLQC